MQIKDDLNDVEKFKAKAVGYSMAVFIFLIISVYIKNNMPGWVFAMYMTLAFIVLIICIFYYFYPKIEPMLKKK